jgi:hypothetical protein
MHVSNGKRLSEFWQLSLLKEYGLSSKLEADLFFKAKVVELVLNILSSHKQTELFPLFIRKKKLVSSSVKRII